MPGTILLQDLQQANEDELRRHLQDLLNPPSPPPQPAPSLPPPSPPPDPDLAVRLGGGPAPQAPAPQAVVLDQPPAPVEPVTTTPPSTSTRDELQAHLDNLIAPAQAPAPEPAPEPAPVPAPAPAPTPVDTGPPRPLQLLGEGLTSLGSGAQNVRQELNDHLTSLLAPTPAQTPTAPTPDQDLTARLGGGAPTPTTPSGPPVERGGDLRAYARQAAERAGVDPNVFTAQIQQESGFSPTAKSPAGALGIAQFMPATAAGRNLDPSDPYASLDEAARMDAEALQRYGGDWGKVLASYNAGPGAVEKYGGVPPYAETQSYVKTIMGNAQKAVDAAGTTVSGAVAAGKQAVSQAVETGKQAVQGALGQVSQFGDSQLTASEAAAACGPAAAVRFAQRYGRNPTLREATDLASSVGWTQGAGMAGIGSEKSLLDKMGVATKLVSGADWGTFANEARTGNPVIISTANHYFTVDNWNPQTNQFHVGRSGLDLRGGKEWMTPEEMVASQGAVQGGLLADNPTAPTSTTSTTSTTPTAAAPAGQEAAQVAQPTPLQVIGQGVQSLTDAAGQAATRGLTVIDDAVDKATTTKPADTAPVASESTTTPTGTRYTPTELTPSPDASAASQPASGEPSSNPLDQVKQKFNDALDSLGSLIQPTGQAASDVGTAAQEAVSGAQQAVGSAAQAAGGVVSEVGTAARQGADTAQGAATGAQDTAQRVRQQVQDTIDNLPLNTTVAQARAAIGDTLDALGPRALDIAGDLPLPMGGTVSDLQAPLRGAQAGLQTVEQQRQEQISAPADLADQFQQNVEAVRQGDWGAFARGTLDLTQKGVGQTPLGGAQADLSQSVSAALTAGGIDPNAARVLGQVANVIGAAALERAIPGVVSAATRGSSAAVTAGLEAIDRLAPPEIALATTRRAGESADDYLARLANEAAGQRPAPGAGQLVSPRGEPIGSTPPQGTVSPADAPTVGSITSRFGAKGEPGMRLEGADTAVPAIVYRDADGVARGGLNLVHDADGNLTHITVAVDPAFQRQGIATAMYDAAKKAGYDVESVSGASGYTEAGAALTNARRAAPEAAPPEPPVFRAPVTGRVADTGTPQRVSPQGEILSPTTGQPVETAGGELAGNIRLPKFVQQPVADIIQQVHAADPARFEAARRGVVTDQMVRDLADEAGTTVNRVAAAWKPGKTANAETTLALRTALADRALRVRTAQNLLKLNPRSIDARNTLVEALNQHAALQEVVSGVTGEAGRVVRQFRQPVTGEQASLAALQRIAKNTHMAPEELAAHLANVDLSDPQAVASLAKTLVGHSFADKAQALWYFNLLSSPVTWTKNLISNGLVAASRPVESLAAAGIDLARAGITGTERQRFMGEAPAEVFGMTHSLGDALRGAYRVMRTGVTPRELENPELAGRTEPFQGRLADLTVNVPGRVLSATDALFRTLNEQGSVYKLAYRQAAQEGTPVSGMADRINEIIRNPTKQLLDQAKAEGEYRIFQNKNAVGQAAMQVREAMPFGTGRFVLPFINTPVNVGAYALERSPLAVAKLAGSAAERSGGQLSDNIARMTLGSALAGYAATQGYQGNITGAAPDDPTDRDAWQREGKQPYSVRAPNGVWYSYAALQPFSSLLAAGAAAGDAWKKGQNDPTTGLNPASLIAITGVAAGRAMIDQPWLQGLSGLVDMLTSSSGGPGQPTDPMKQISVNAQRALASGVVPAGVRLLARAFDPTSRTSDPGFEGFGQQLAASIPGLTQNAPPRLGAFGQPIQRPGGSGVSVLNPFNPSPETDDPVEKELRRLQDGGYDVEPSLAGKRVTLIGEAIGLTPDQQRQYQMLSGVMTHDLLSSLLATDAYKSLPSDKQALVINRLGDRVADAARKTLYPSLLDQAVERKIAQTAQRQQATQPGIAPEEWVTRRATGSAEAPTGAAPTGSANVTVQAAA